MRSRWTRRCGDARKRWSRRRSSESGSSGTETIRSTSRTLLAAVNIERPMSETLLRSILEHDDTGAFSRDPEAPDSYTYVPGTTP